MLADAELVAFAAARDLDAAEAFYGGVLGLALVDSTPFAKVDDLEAAMAELRDRGVEFTRYEGLEQDEAGAWTAPGGSRIAWFADPDGNTLSLQQAP